MHPSSNRNNPTSHTTMTYAEAILEQINSLREHRVDALADGKITQAGHIQKAIVRLYDRYCALTGDISY